MAEVNTPFKPRMVPGWGHVQIRLKQPPLFQIVMRLSHDAVHHRAHGLPEHTDFITVDVPT